MIAGIPAIFVVLVVFCSLLLWYILFKALGFILPKFVSFLSKLTPNWIKVIFKSLTKLIPKSNTSHANINSNVNPLFWKILAKKINELGIHENFFENNIYTYAYEATEKEVVLTKHKSSNPFEIEFVNSYSIEGFYYYPPNNLRKINPELWDFICSYDEDSYTMYK